MKIIKRNGAEVVFDIDKIRMAVTKANNAVEESVRMTPLQISRIAESVEISCEEMGRSPAVEEIQDLVEKAIMAHGAFEVAKEYITYRYTRSLLRQSNTTDTSVVVTKFDIGEGMQGMIGVVGPTRMDYAKVTARLSYFAESLTKMFGKGELPAGEVQQELGPERRDDNEN